MTDNPFPSTPRPDAELLNAYLDGTLDEADRARVASAIAADDDLRAELAELRAIRQLLASLPELAPPTSFCLDSSHARRSSGSTPYLRLLPIVRSLSVAAIVTFLIVTGTLLVNRNDDDAGDLAALPDSAPTTVVAAQDASGTGSFGGASESAEDEMAESAPQVAAAVPRDEAPGAAFDEELEATPPPAADSESESADVAMAPARAEESVEPKAVASEPEPVDSSADDDDTLVWWSVGTGALAVVLLGSWITISRMQRSRRSTDRNV